jgi:hypothetical protein
MFFKFYAILYVVCYMLFITCQIRYGRIQSDVTGGGGNN